MWDLCGTISVSSLKNKESYNDMKSYKPPLKKKKQKKLDKQLKKKTQPKETIQDVLILEDELSNEEQEPLKLTDTFSEKENYNSPKKIEKSLSPAARKMAKEARLDINKISGTGKNGLVLKEDVMSLMGVKPQPSERRIKFGPEERIKMTRLRQTIAKRLKEAQENAAMLTTFNEVDMHEVINMRNNYKEEFQKYIQ